MNKKAIFSIFCSAFFLFNLLLSPAYSNPVLVINANSSAGKWGRGMVANREVVFTNKPLIKSEVQVYIENPGKYYLFSYVYHNYREAIPCVYVEVSNYKGILYRGSRRIENIWYLDKADPGRWFMVSLTQEPYWELPKGYLTLRFWADAFRGVWDDSKISMEGVVAIDKLFLVPIEESVSGMGLPWFISLAVEDEGLGKVYYHPYHAADLIRFSIGKGKDSFLFKAHIPRSGFYRLGCSIFSTSDNNLNLLVEGKPDKLQADVKIKGSNVWSFVDSSPVYLEKGQQDLKLTYAGTNEVLVDYLLLTPCDKEDD